MNHKRTINNVGSFPQTDYLITIDSVSIDYIAKYPIMTGINYGEITVIDLDKSSTGFAKTLEVYFDGMKVGILRCTPLYPTIGKNIVRYVPVNQTLYLKKRMYILAILERNLSLTFSNYSQIDIACDSAHNSKIIEILSNYSIEAEESIVCSNDSIDIKPKAFNHKTRKFEAFHLGSKKSTKCARVYRKDSEVVRTNKEYIKNYWKENGLAGVGVNPIFRFEFSIRSKGLKETNQFGTQLLNNAALLFSLFKKTLTKWMKFFKIHHHHVDCKKDYAISKGTEMHLFDWNKFQLVELIYSNTIVSPSEISSAKRCISFLMKKNQFDGSMQEAVTKVTRVLIDKYRLHKWMIGRGFQLPESVGLFEKIKRGMAWLTGLGG